MNKSWGFAVKEPMKKGVKLCCPFLNESPKEALETHKGVLWTHVETLV